MLGARSEVLARWARYEDGARQRVNSYWRTVVDGDPKLAGAVAILEVVLGGDIVIRVATKPIRLTSSIDSKVYAFDPGLAGLPSIPHDSSLGGGAAQVRTINITIPGTKVTPGASPWTAITRGRALAGVGELALVVEGTDYDNRLVLMRGEITGASFGTSSQYVSISLSDPKLVDSALVPDISASEERWASIGDDAIGKRYPLVLNGGDRIYCLPVVYNVPSPGKFLVAQGWGWGSVRVWVNGEEKLTGDGTYPWVKEQTKDLLGEPVTLIDFTGGAATWVDRDAVHASVTADTSVAGGLGSRAVVPMIRDLLRGYTSLGNAGINSDLFADAEGRMPSWVPRIVANASGNKAVPALEFIENEILAAFPMLSLVYEGRGIGPVFYDRRAKVQGALVRGQFPLRERMTDLIESSKTEWFNEFEVRYGYDAIADRYTGLVRVDATNSAACRLCRSDAFAGTLRAHAPIESPWIPDETAANGIASWLVAHKCLPSYSVEYTIEPWAFFRYRRGMNVTLTDAQIGIVSAVSTIERLDFDAQNPTIRLRIWHPYWTQDGVGLAT